MTDTPALSWFHVGYDVIGTKHLHIQEANQYPGLRFHWSLDAETNERRSRFFIRSTEYGTLNDAIAAWIEKNPKPKRHRERL